MSATASCALKMVDLIAMVRRWAAPRRTSPLGGQRRREAASVGALSYPPREVGGLADVRAGGHRKQAVLLGLRDLQRADQRMQVFASDGLAARHFLELLVRAVHAVAAHDGL